MLLKEHHRYRREYIHRRTKTLGSVPQNLPLTGFAKRVNLGTGCVGGRHGWKNQKGGGGGAD